MSKLGDTPEVVVAGGAEPVVKVHTTAENTASNAAPAEQLHPRGSVAFIHSEDIGLCDLSFCVPQHAMKPWRVAATTKLVEALGIADRLTMVQPPTITLAELKAYHCPDYLHNLVLHNAEPWEWGPDYSHAQLSGDCPPVPGIAEYSCAVAAGSLTGAQLLRNGECRTAIHWGGGMHHARCGECSGFCYVNDIVIAILDMLQNGVERVLYIDLDVHHGDGVEEAFYTSDQVFCLSLHKFGDSYFPGTGSPTDVGADQGKFYSMNLALWDGIGDFHYTSIFKAALDEIVSVFKPSAVVLQCGADSLAGDRVGVFNLSSLGHARCVELVAQLDLPLLVLGGGGYSIKNVVKLWAFETSVLCGMKLPPSTKLPVFDPPKAHQQRSLPVDNKTAAGKKRKRGEKQATAAQPATPVEADAQLASNAVPKSDFSAFTWLFNPSHTIHVPMELTSDPSKNINVAAANEAIVTQIQSHMRKLAARIGLSS